MRKDKLAVLIIFAVAVVAAAAFQFLRGPGQDPTVTAPPGSNPPPQKRPPADSKKVLAAVVSLRPDVTSGAYLSLLALPDRSQMRGLGLGLHSADPANPYEKYLDEIAATGANTVSMVVAAYQENASSSSMFVDGRKTPPDGRIKELIAYAHAKALRVIVMPILLLENPRAGEWRGKIEPGNWDAWWDRYYDYILQYARLARDAKADVFVVGSELVSTETQTDRWRDLIKQVRGIFPGLLTYSANWDHYDTPEFWADLDLIGMTAYHDMSTPQHPTVEQLVEAWKPIKQKILAWRAKVGLPLLFTEVGWPNQITCANQPWNYCPPVDQPDPEAQANCFEAFFRAWLDEKSVGGMMVWEWRNNPTMVGGPQDATYIPCGKPAEKVLLKYFQMAEPAPSQPPVAMTPAASDKLARQ